MAMFIPRTWLTDECLEAAEGRPPKGRTIPVFRQPLIERYLARAHPSLPGIWCGPLSALCVAKYLTSGGSALGALSLVASGWLGFGLFEYVLHRFVFHRAFADSPDGRLESFLTHGYHHAYPNDGMRLVMPPIIAWPLAVVVWAIERVALGPSISAAVFAGTLLGYVTYDWTHYYTHHARPTTRLGRWMRAYHLLHHHDDEGGRFGVSSPLWDVAFGTFRGTRARSRRKQPDAEGGSSAQPEDAHTPVG